MTHTTLQEAMGSPYYIPTLRINLKKLFKQAESETLNSLTSRGLFIVGNEERLKEEIKAVAEDRSQLPANEQQYLLRMAFVAMATMKTELKKWQETIGTSYINDYIYEYENICEECSR